MEPPTLEELTLLHANICQALGDARRILINHGKMQRDFTYIGEIAEGTVRVLDLVAKSNHRSSTDLPDPGTSYAPYRIYNIGNHQPVELMAFLKEIENCLGMEAKKNYLPMQLGDVITTYADVDDLKRDTGFQPKIDLTVGIARWIEWYRSYTGK